MASLLLRDHYISNKRANKHKDMLLLIIIWQRPINKSAALNRATRGKKKFLLPPQHYTKMFKICILVPNRGGFACYPRSSEAVLFCNHADHRTNPDDWGFILDIGGPRDIFMALPGDSYPTIILYILSLLSHLL